MDTQIKVLKLKRSIQDLEEQIAFFTSAITLVMDEQDRLDMEVEEYIIRTNRAREALRDLRAELADTV